MNERGDPAADSVRFAYVGTTSDERPTLDLWCRAVGSALVQSSGMPQPDTDIRRVVVVGWNNGVGCGDLPGLLGRLRTEGTLGPTDGLVVLAQEVLRVGTPVPPLSDLAGLEHVATERLHSCTPVPIDELARREKLHLVYVPSMRNGYPGVDPDEDRGNAVLSSLPLHDLRALEPPIVGQRRVAVSAEVALGPGAEAPRLRLLSLHLDITGTASYGRIFTMRGRLRQAHSLLRATPRDQPLVVAGDLNTWGGTEEPAVRYLSRALPDPDSHPRAATAAGTPARLFGIRLDHMFGDLPESWELSYEVHPDAWGSDHNPLVGVLNVGRR